MQVRLKKIRSTATLPQYQTEQSAGMDLVADLEQPMTLQPGEEIGEETHDDGDQFFRFEDGKGEVLIDGVRHQVEDDFAVIVPAGARHNVINTGDGPLQLYTLYGPPEHRHDVVQPTKADETEEHFDGKTSE